MIVSILLREQLLKFGHGKLAKGMESHEILKALKRSYCVTEFHHIHMVQACTGKYINLCNTIQYHKSLK